MDESTTKIWKERPPGEEQLHLEEMFTSGCITSYATPEAVQNSSPLFTKFPPRTFAAHFRKTKAKMGEYLSTARGVPGGVVPLSPPRRPAKSAMSKIPELGAISQPPSLKRSFPLTLDATVDIVNPPYNTWQYTDHDLKIDFVCVSISIFTGSSSITFNITEDGLKIIVRFAWPTAIYKATEMFAKELHDGTSSKHHPMIQSMNSALLASGVTESSKPEGQWIIPLPCKVRREINSYTMTKIESGNSKIMLLRFTAYQNDLIIDQANRTMTFD